MERRRFIKQSVLTSTAMGLAPLVSFGGNRVSANDKINVALVGCRNMGFGILRHAVKNEDVNCVALCDIDSNVLTERAGEIKQNYNPNVKTYKDYRKLLEDKDIDAVIIGTPDHWHCLNMVDSCEAGKDVYVEKPMSNTIEECNIMVKAAKRYDKVVQVGQQQRDNKVFLDCMDLIKSGQIGNLRKVNMWANFNYGVGPEVVPDSPVPAGVDYDMWLGPAPEKPFNRNRFHGSWRHFWDYGGGLMSDWGVHLLDMGLWAKDLVQAPKKVMTYFDNTYHEKRARETFDTMNVLYPKADFVINWDMTAGVQQGPYDMLYGVAFIGDKGTLVANRSSYQLYPEWNNQEDKPMTRPVEFSGGQESHAQHVRNFLDCIKTRETPSCPPEVGRAAALHAHIPNIAGRVGESILEWDDDNNRFINCEKANELIKPEYRSPWKLPKV
ncbi:MAG: Gfo/Idh/MocA family protein [Candidatus Cyclobacteriaceae bacterium M3_2C_046]